MVNKTKKSLSLSLFMVNNILFLRNERWSNIKGRSCLSVIMDGISVKICCFFKGGLSKIIKHHTSAFITTKQQQKDIIRVELCV